MNKNKNNNSENIEALFERLKTSENVEALYERLIMQTTKYELQQ